MAWMACLNRKQIIAVSLETAMQNVGIAVLVLQVVMDSGYPTPRIALFVPLFVCNI